MLFPHKDEVLEIHRKLIEQFGGLPGIRDEGLLDSALLAAANRQHYQGADRTRPLLADGLFGPPFDRLLPRLGDLVVPPYATHSAFWSEPGRFEMRHRASHGGLTPEEMETGLYLLHL